MKVLPLKDMEKTIEREHPNYAVYLTLPHDDVQDHVVLLIRHGLGIESLLATNAKRNKLLHLRQIDEIQQVLDMLPANIKGRALKIAGWHQHHDNCPKCSGGYFTNGPDGYFCTGCGEYALRW